MNGTYISVATLHSDQIRFVPFRWNQKQQVSGASGRIRNVADLKNGLIVFGSNFLRK